MKTTGGTWNAGYCCGKAVEKKIDDVEYFNSMINALISKYKADAKNIFLSGWSNGGDMVYRLTC